MAQNRNFMPDRSRPGLPTTATITVDQQGGSGKCTTVGKCVREEVVNHVRIGTVNVGTMTGRGREIVDLMERRKIRILCVQETKWKGEKAKEMGGGYKLFYCGKTADRNGIGILLDQELKENVVSVKRVSDRIMWMRLGIANEVINVISAYAPQAGCPTEEKEEFWNTMEGTVTEVKREERLYIGADLNGHVGEGNDGIERWIGKHGYGTRNAEGDRIEEFVIGEDLAVLNTFYKKPEEHLATYQSGGRKTQIDYLLCWRRDLKEVSDCKVIPGENAVPQHKLVMAKVSFRVVKQRMKRGNPKTKWWKLKEEITKLAFVDAIKDKFGESLPMDWEITSNGIRAVGKEVCGVSTGRGKENKETWWWNNEVQAAIKEKKEARKSMDANKDEESKVRYKVAKQEAKKEVAKAKKEAYQELYDGMETAEGQKDIFRIAKQREKETRDIQHVKMIRDENGHILTKEKDIKERWKAYYNQLMNEENPRQQRNEVLPPNNKEIEKIDEKEVWTAVCKMKNGKAVGPDGIPAEAWKCLGGMGCRFLCWLFNELLRGEKMPNDWRESVMIPIYKNKGDVQDCSNYRGIKLMSHTMKIWERVIDRRIRAEVEICDQQFGFVSGKSTTDAIFALRRTIEKYREKERNLHCVFIDLEKAYDRVPREEVWHCMREKGVSEQFITIVKDMYEGSKTTVSTASGMTEPFNVNVGLHQGSALSPLLFAIVIDALTGDIRREAPWNMLYADDVALLNETKEDAEQELEKWRDALEKRGLRVSRSKTEYLCIGPEVNGMTIRMGDAEVPEVKEFKYLGSTVQQDGGGNIEVRKRIQAGWNSWRKVTGVMCDKRMPAKLKGKVYKAVIRPAMTYGLETIPLTKKQEGSMDTAEMKMLRWSMGWTRKDMVRNTTIRSLTGVDRMSVKTKESRLRWFGHVKRREESYVGKKVLNLEVEGKRRRGRPKGRWMDVIRADMRELELEEEDALDRNLWRSAIHYSNPANCRTS